MNERKREAMRANEVFEDMQKTAAAMQMLCALIARPSKDGSVRWTATIGEMRETHEKPNVAYGRLLLRLAKVNKALGANFSSQMDVARAKGARETPC